MAVPAYDANGNLVAEQQPTGTDTYTWGYENELLTVFEPDGTLVTMTYDGDLKRRKRAEGAGWTTYLWDREQVLMELNKTGTTTVRYTQAPRGYGDMISQRRSSASTYWHFDAIGSMRFLTAADQSKAINYVYDAFGITRSVSGTTTNRFRYIGKLGYYLEPALGCYYLRRRYYVHWLGRFLSKDPIRRGGENAYGYVRNAPTRGVDPSGQIPLWPWDPGYPPPPGGGGAPWTVPCEVKCAPLLALGPVPGAIWYAECVWGCKHGPWPPGFELKGLHDWCDVDCERWENRCILGMGLATLACVAGCKTLAKYGEVALAACEIACGVGGLAAAHECTKLASECRGHMAQCDKCGPG
ncbi:MAG: RHS repeat-associated core domain-containing protein [Armatimonadetes bacterium]|nr:RHS repeat-associated core domain-containing protein [Armatimonadota bacterium]